jgi:hypothetical protein
LHGQGVENVKTRRLDKAARIRSIGKVRTATKPLFSGAFLRSMIKPSSANVRVKSR